MEIKSLEWWEFTDEPTEGCELKCPTCGEFSAHTLWYESEIYCETCGEHVALSCPKCRGQIDMIYHDPIEVRNPSA